MLEDLNTIEMNIAHYEAMLKQDHLDDGKRSLVRRLLAEAKRNLVLATALRKTNISRYEAMLTVDLDDGKRSLVRRLLAEAKEEGQEANVR